MSESMSRSTVPGLALPRSFEEFTPDWFTRALAARFPGVEVTEIERSRERVGTSASCQFSLTYASRGDAGDAPSSVYIKGGFTPKQLKRYWTVLQQEAHFFLDMADEIPMNIPDCYFAATDDAQQGITMLEDMKATRGARFGNWGALNRDEVAALLEQFASMHARWAGDPRLGPLKGNGQAQRDYFKYLIRESHWEELKQRQFGHRLDALFPDVQSLRDALDAMWALNDSEPATLCHGDPHGGNMFFERDGTPGVLDFQLYFASTPMHDASWLIVSSLPVEERRKEEAHLLRHYLDAARANGLELHDFDRSWLIYRQQMAHAVLGGACNPLEGGPLFMINNAGEVTTIAAEDHDVLDALGIVSG
ncbi:ecdysteroid 22-kinase family protein [Sphingomonas colocasiae]|uniref:Ecdysteroid 22-kinase family protein n=1 Tax=Sphingomonas colocasiae TaxID=1848973 RepID=A0ABS7PU97_9SPHN|nr:ecdysteroid 22-kinase family protein [Sphingomonas colocasiae]MBY8824917.1 ecdysteroid 22-kinase family protein [Sphingomonas colocasiae]